MPTEETTPRPAELIFQERLAFPKEIDPNGQDFLGFNAEDFTVSNETKELKIMVYVNATQLGPYAISGGVAKGNNGHQVQPKAVTLFSPRELLHECYFRGTNGVDHCTRLVHEPKVAFAMAAGERIEGPLEFSIKDPAEGAWAMLVAALGENAYVEGIIVAHYGAAASEPAN